MAFNEEDPCVRIISSRKYGRTTCVIKDHPTIDLSQGFSVNQLVDRFVEQLGFAGLGADWTEIPPEDSKLLATQVLSKDLAYGQVMMPMSDARSLAEGFAALFTGRVRCFTNGNFVLPHANPRLVPGSGYPISSSTFDSGVVCLDEKQIGILWVQDED